MIHLATLWISAFRVSHGKTFECHLVRMIHVVAFYNLHNSYLLREMSDLRKASSFESRLERPRVAFPGLCVGACAEIVDWSFVSAC